MILSTDFLFYILSMFSDKIDMVAGKSWLDGRILHIPSPTLMLYDYSELCVGISKNLRYSICGIRFIYIEWHNGLEMLFNRTYMVYFSQFKRY